MAASSQPVKDEIIPTLEEPFEDTGGDVIDQGKCVCLICSSDCSPSENEYVHPSSSSPPFSSPSPRFRNHLRTFFLFIHVLELPPEQIETFLRYFPHPDKWVQICSECSANFVDKCQETYVELLRARSKFRAARAKLINAVKQSFDKVSPKVADNVNVKPEASPCLLIDITQDARDYVCKRKYYDLKESQLPKSLPVLSSTAPSKVPSAGPCRQSTAERSPHHPPRIEAKEDRNDKCSVDNNQDDEGDDNEDDWNADNSVDSEDDLSLSKTEENSSKDSEDDESDSSESSDEEAKDATGSSPVSCHICGKMVKREQYLRRHIMTHADEAPRPFQCQTCPSKYATNRSLARHRVHAHPDYYANQDKSCPTCGRVFATMSSLQNHIWLVHERKFQTCCELCGKILASPKNLALHMKWVHKLGPGSGERTKKRACTEPGCTRKFGTKTGWDNHQTYHERKRQESEIKEFYCEHCGKKFANLKYLRSHLLTVHADLEAKHFQCEQCGMGFAVKRSLTLHVNSRHGSDGSGSKLIEYPCPKDGCKKICRSEVWFKKHMEYHDKYDKEPMFNCDQCGKMFYKRERLRTHKVIMHSINRETKPFRCQVCGKGFAVQRYLGLHLKTHKKLQQ